VPIQPIGLNGIYRHRFLEIEHLGFSRQIDQVGSAIEGHVCKKVLLVNLTSRGAWNSNADGDMIFYQVRQIIIGAITGGGLDVQGPFGIGPVNAVVDKKHIRLVPFGMSNLGKLEAPRCGLIVFRAQNKQKIRHGYPPYFKIYGNQSLALR
jgi:hypothetical protein